MKNSLFKDLKLSQDLIDKIKSINYKQPTPIQIQCIPIILQGKDLLGQAQTGTGKTAAFILPIVDIINSKGGKALILSPTRELSIQIHEFCKSASLKNIYTTCCYGGVSYGPQISDLKKSNIIIGTPGRILDLISKEYIKLTDISFLVLDEADRMFSMGFIDDIKTVLEGIPKNCQKMLFSATFSKDIVKTSKKYLDNPYEVKIKSDSSTADNVQQSYLVIERNKEDAIDIILDCDEDKIGGVVIFANTKKETIEVSNALRKKGKSNCFLNGDIAQNQRNKILEDFKNMKYNILVATDVAARGLDIDHITHVFQLDLPYDFESYVHRIGRTGRIGRYGKAFVFVARSREKEIQKFVKKLNCNIEKLYIPDQSKLASIRLNLIIKNLHEISKKRDLTEFKDMIKNSSIDNNLDLIAALLYLIQVNRPISFGKEHFISSRSFSNSKYKGRKKYIIYAVSAGKNQGINVSNILRVLNKSLIRQHNIGKIDIRDNISLVQIRANTPSFVLNEITSKSILNNKFYLYD